MMLVNELAQWAVLLFLSVVVFGLVRQLGQFIVSRRDQLLYLGPDIGKQLPVGLLEGLPTDRLKRDVRASQAGLGLLVVMNDRCNGCKGLVAQLEVLGQPLDGPLVALADSRVDEFTARLEEVFTYVLDDQDGQRAHSAGIIATPFVLTFDSELTVKHRGISGGLHELVVEWLGSSTPVIKQGSPMGADAIERPVAGGIN